MARKKNSSDNNYKQLIGSQIKSKYVYLLLGLTVILVGYFSLKSFLPKEKSLILKKNVEITKTTEINTKIYLTKQGDYLWKIAEESYGSGYNAYDIAQANNISDPNIIYSGTSLILPKVAPKQPTKGEIAPIMTEQVTLTAAKYTVQPGDYLWKIALEAYGDGFAWVRIAKVNNIQNPDLIDIDTVLLIPR